VLRYHGLGTWSFWVDEAHTWRDATMPLGGPLGFLSQDRALYPLTFLLLRGLMAIGMLGGATEDWLRSPFACCGILTVPLLAYFGARVVGRRAGLLASFLLAICPWHIYWSQNARGYVMVTFFATMGAIQFFRGCDRGRRWPIVLGLLNVLIGGLFHPTAFVMLPTLLIFLLMRRVRRFDRWFWFVVAGSLALLAVTPVLIAKVSPYEDFLRSKGAGSVAHLATTSAYYFRLPLVLIALAGGALLFATELRHRVVFLMTWALFPLLLLAAVGSTVAQVTARYGFAALPAFLLLAAAGSVRFGQLLGQAIRAQHRGSRLLPSIVLPAVLTADFAAYDFLYYRHQHGDRARWREAAALVQKLAKAQPIRVLTTNQPSALYYLDPQFYRDPVGPAGERPSGVEVIGIEGFEAYRQGGDASRWLSARVAEGRRAGRAVFALITMPELVEDDPEGRLRESLARDFYLLQVVPCWVGPKDETIFVYEPR
jgi:4-amino-4-deoxy-L-arabinose transferase-like glycosyltransferase